MAADIGACLEPEMVDTELRGAYAVLKHWYRHASARVTNPSQADLAKVTKDYTTVYQQGDPDPPSQPLASHVDLSQISNEVPTEVQVGAAVQCLLPHKTGRHTHLHAENFKTWLREAYPGEGTNPLPKTGRWMQLVAIVQYMWSTRDIPR